MKGWTVRRIEVPTPYTVGPVNCFLLRGDALVLVDTGPTTRMGLNLIKAALKKFGARLKNLDAILLTHAHIDHFGMGALLKDHSDAPVWGHADDRVFLEGFPQSHLRMVKRLGDHSILHGFPPALFRRIASLYTSSLECGRALDVDRFVKDGERLTFGGEALAVIHCPGHTAGSVCYFDPATGTLFGGDTILEKTTPIAFFRGHAPTARIGLSCYLRSLKRLDRYHVRRVCPGHRRPFTRFRPALRAIERHIRGYKRRVLRCLNRGPRSAWDISREVFPDARVIDQWLAFAKTLGVLEHLVEERHAAERAAGESARVFALRTGAPVGAAP